MCVCVWGGGGGGGGGGGIRKKKKEKKRGHFTCMQSLLCSKPVSGICKIRNFVVRQKSQSLYPAWFIVNL